MATQSLVGESLLPILEALFQSDPRTEYFAATNKANPKLMTKALTRYTQFLSCRAKAFEAINVIGTSGFIS